MASPTDASIADVLEDLDLYRAILESLDEQRPEAFEERQETIDTIKGLEAKLAQLGGDRANDSQSPCPIPDAVPDIKSPSLFQAQLDGGGFSSQMPSSSPPVFGRSALSSQSSHPPHKSSEMPSGRKRRRDEDSEDLRTAPLGPSVKRTPSGFGFGQPVSSSASSPEEKSDEEFDEDFLSVFGVDSRDTFRALQAEQKKAEKWLAERKEQERRDEEYARRLMHTIEPTQSSSPQSSSSTNYSGSPLPLRTLPSPTRAPHSRGIPQPHWPPKPSSGSPSNKIKTKPVGFGPALYPQTIHHRPPLPSQKYNIDSDDSDITEITARDFQRHTGVNPTYRGPPGLYISGASSSVRDDRPGNHFPSGSRPNPFMQPGLVPGPSGIGRQEPGYGSRVFQNTMDRLKAGRELLERAGRSVFGGYSTSHDPFKEIITSFAGDGVNGSLGYLNDFYEQGADPKQLNQEIKQLLETIRPDSDISKEDQEEGTPKALKYSLLDHQKLGLAWMKSKEEQEQKGGILADDMGLGKTIQAISLIVSRPSTDPERKTTLIIAPVALMQQWKREIQKMLRPGTHQLSVYILHGEKRAVGFRKLKDYDVILTTFGTLSSELKRIENYEKLLKGGADEPTLTTQYLASLPCLGPTSKWYRVIIDEAQCIKNRNTKSAIACCRINSTYRWCMSGTPMMNSVEELHSLLKFLRIRPYCDRDAFNRDFTRPLKSNIASSQDKAMTQLRVLLKAVLLRRTKTSKIDGKPILPLPARISEKVHAAFSDDELELYTSLETKTQLQFNRYLEAGTIGRNYSNILVLLLRLRQACCHPHLIRDFSVKVNANTDELNLITNAKAFSNEVVVRLRDNNDLECPICIDAVDNPVIFFPCGHSTCAECFSRISDPALALRQGIDGAVQVKCPNCRGMVDPKKITDHVSFKKVHFPDGLDDSTELDSGLPSQDDEDDEDDSEDDDDDSLSRFIVDKDDDEGRAPKKSKSKGKQPRKTLAELKKVAMKNQASKRKYIRRLEKTWITSAKIEKTMGILRDIQEGELKEKTIIFSQFTSLLDLLEVPIVREGLNYRRYDGSMKPADRNSAVLDFTDDPECRIMLVSLKAGNSGLNLVAASHVIIFDPFWNPYVEEQAIDRAHRIGQEREVHIHRILVPNTVEDRILELQEKKREIIEGALDENASKNISRLSTRELRYLFGIDH